MSFFRSKTVRGLKGGKKTDLQKACEAGKTQEVYKLLQNPNLVFQINLPDENGWTLLHLTVNSASTALVESDLFNYLTICKMLLDAGADPSLGTGKSDNTGFHLLCKICVPPNNESLRIFYVSLLAFMAGKGADINKPNKEGVMPIHEACTKGSIDAVMFLLDGGVDPNCITLQGQTPLHYAIASGHDEVVRVLLERAPLADGLGANPDLKTTRGTPREAAMLLKMPKIVKLFELYDQGAIGRPAAQVPVPVVPVKPTLEAESRASSLLDESSLTTLVDMITSNVDEAQLLGTTTGSAPPKTSPLKPQSNIVMGSRHEAATPPALPSLPSPSDPPPAPPTASPKTQVEGRVAPNFLAQYSEEELLDQDGPDLKFRFDDTNGTLTIRAATVDRLVQRLTSNRDPGQAFIQTFLYTYSAYISDQELLAKLIERYNTASNETWQLRVLGLMKAWVEIMFSDFENNFTLSTSLFEFLGSITVPSHCRIVDQITRSFDQQKEIALEKTRQLQAIAVKPSGTEPTLTDFMNMDDRELAHQLTLYQSSLFLSIPLRELFNRAWTGEDKEKRAPHVVAAQNDFNKLSAWVVTEVLQKSEPSERALVIQKFINLAKCFRNLNNFNSLQAILSGLAAPPVKRLMQTWEVVDAEIFLTLEDLEQLMAPAGSYKSYRTLLKTGVVPCTPYLGLYLGELIFIDQANPNEVEDNLINFYKFSKIANVLADIRFYQNNTHASNMVSLKFKPEYLEWWKNVKVLEEQEAFEISLTLEARAADEVLPTGAEENRLRKENEELKLRIAQLEELVNQQAETIKNLNDKIKSMQQDLRMSRDTNVMLAASALPDRSSLVAKPLPSTPTRTSQQQTSDLPAYLANSSIDQVDVPYTSPRLSIPPPMEMPPPPPVAAAADETPHADPTPQPVAAPATAAASAGSVLARIREKYKLNSSASSSALESPGSTTARSESSSAATPSPPVTTATSVLDKIRAQREAGSTSTATSAAPVGSMAAALREKYGLGAKPGASPSTTSPLRAPSSDHAAGENAAPAAPAPKGDAAARLAELRAKYKAAKAAAPDSSPPTPVPTTTSVGASSGGSSISPRPKPPAAAKRPAVKSPAGTSE